MTEAEEKRQIALRDLEKKYKQLKYHGNTGGYRYLKQGDPVGELCPMCAQELLINKSKKWFVYCHCGHEELFRRREVDFDPHWSEIDDQRAMQRRFCDWNKKPQP